MPIFRLAKMLMKAKELEFFAKIFLKIKGLVQIVR